MRNLARSLGMIALSLLGASCVSYSGVAKSPDGQLYISGGTNYFVYTDPWIRLCTVDGLRLICVELSESPSAPASPKSAPPSRAAAATPPPAQPAPPAPPAQ